MSYLAINQFDASFTTYDMKQKVASTAMIKAIRLKMLRYGVLIDGTLTLEVYDGALLLGTKTMTYTELNSAGGTYAHGYFAFIFDKAIRVNLLKTTTDVELTFRITMSGHTPNSNIYLGIIRQFENEFITEYGLRPAAISPEEDGWYNPFGLEILTID